MIIETKLIQPGSANRPSTRKVEYITIHETGNYSKGADADAHATYLASAAAVTAKVSWHYTVDDKKAICHVPDGEIAWHCGSTTGNATSIGIEICVNEGGDFEAAIKNAAELTGELLKKYGLTTAKVVQHNYWSGKDCPKTIRATGRWEEFLAMVRGESVVTPVTGTGRYEVKDGVHFRYTPQEKWRLLYWDKAKRTTTVKDYGNGGFFALYAEKVGSTTVYFTLPVANLVADIDEASVEAVPLKYLKEIGTLAGGKLRIDCRRNTSAQFKGKSPTTLIIDSAGKASIKQLNALPDDVRYAVSGVPVMLSGRDVSWSSEVLAEGWDGSVVGAGWHTFLAVKDGNVVRIGMQTQKANCISSSEAYNRLKAFGFTDAIKLDGGDSFIFDSAGKNVAVSVGDRRINNLAAEL